MSFRILVGSYTNEIYTISFDPDTPKLTLESTLTVGHHPSWITPHPTDPSLVFTGLERDGGKAVVVRYDAEGKGTVVGEAPSGGADPCTLLALGTELLIGNYSSGTFADIPLTYEPPHLQASKTTVLQFEGTGPNKERQEASHPHQIYLHPARAELLIPDLGADLARRFVRDAGGKWVPNGELKYKAGGGPRHVVVYNDILYTVHELTNELSAYRFPPAPEEATHIATVPTLQLADTPHEAASNMFASEILLPAPNASFPTAYVYVSNRDDPSPGNDTIAIFSPADSDGGLKMVAEVRSGLKHLRGMVFGGPDDKWLMAGGVHGGGVKVFERIDGGKGLKEIASLELEAPTGFLWI
ncbi:Lactonase, 7-bladed beta-propeller-domain-containing protein [Fomitopsis serialis]|uniref:Lactonase, 7-bladed beta-propeller-domain-containing protein n=1 Tax=Fomitopsis serialis TaxID=139415 RepID=UPI002008190F|nr:Lactonase, 7-bladed beta-propeller-domain-containing protein [Neoantrodia serialis]KAH9922105.1 Lactonase, 7-bladed beta-propeller-domain-containing protein [Neoantrodia serialis]